MPFKRIARRAGSAVKGVAKKRSTRVAAAVGAGTVGAVGIHAHGWQSGRRKGVVEGYQYGQDHAKRGINALKPKRKVRRKRR